MSKDTDKNSIINKTEEEVANECEAIEEQILKFKDDFETSNSSFDIERIKDNFREVLKYWLKRKYGSTKPNNLIEKYNCYFKYFERLLICLEHKQNKTAEESNFFEKFSYRGLVSRNIFVEKLDDNKDLLDYINLSDTYSSWSYNFPRHLQAIMFYKSKNKIIIEFDYVIKSPDIGICINAKELSIHSNENEVIFPTKGKSNPRIIKFN